jgi:hypothetical protein
VRHVAVHAAAAVATVHPAGSVSHGLRPR